MILILSVILLAYANGANDNFKAVATIYGSSTLSYRQSLLVATIAQLLGSVTSVVLAGALLHAFGGKGLVLAEVVANPLFLIAVSAGAAATVLLASKFGFPVSTTHAIIGSLTGAGLALASTEFVWSGLGPKFIAPLLLTPLMATVAAALLYPPLSRIRKKMGVGSSTCLCVGTQIEPVGVMADGVLVTKESGVRLSVAEAAQCRTQYSGAIAGVTAQQLADWLHILSASSLGFARGMNDTPKVMALLVAAAWSGFQPRIALSFVAAAMALGGVLHSAQIARTMGKRITIMNSGQGLLGNLVASCLVIGASLLGSPVSTTHVSTGAIFGIGLWTRSANRRVVIQILLAWLITLPVGAAIAYSIAMTG